MDFFCFCSRTRLRRSNTLGRVDTHAQAQTMRRPLADSSKTSGVVTPASLVHANFLSPSSLFTLSKASSSSSPSPGPKMEPVIVCLDCKDVVERVEQQELKMAQLRLQSSDEDASDEYDEEDEEEEVPIPVSARDRRLRLTKSLVLS